MYIYVVVCSAVEPVYLHFCIEEIWSFFSLCKSDFMLVNDMKIDRFGCSTII